VARGPLAAGVSKSVNLNVFYPDVHSLLGAGTVVSPDTVPDKPAGAPIRFILLRLERSQIIVCRPSKSVEVRKGQDMR